MIPAPRAGAGRAPGQGSHRMSQTLLPILLPSLAGCPFHKYTASACGLASFPRKRETRRRAPWGLDARLRGHDVLLAQDLRNGHLASLKDWCALSDKRRNSLAEICRVATGGNELGLVLHLGFQRLTRAIVEQGFRTSVGLRRSLRQLRGKILDSSLELLIGEDLMHNTPLQSFTGTEHTVQEREFQSPFH